MKEVLNSLNIKQVLTQNAKMKKSSKNGTAVFNWTIPAYKALDGTITCPNASKCIKGCYAKQGAYIWKSVSKAHNAKLQLTRHDLFVDIMVNTIQTKLKNKNHKRIIIRIHDAGDFYNLEYVLKWYSVMKVFQNESRVLFYAYTKQVELFNTIKGIKPINFKLIYSYGGKQDSQIDTATDRHARVFQSEIELDAAGYINASQDDMLALTDNKKIGLVYHGTKSYEKTTWNKVSQVEAYSVSRSKAA